MKAALASLVIAFSLTYLLLELTFELSRRLSSRPNKSLTSHSITTPFNWSASSLSALSFKTNLIQRRIQQLVCLSGRDVTDTGGWCNSVVDVEHRTDAELGKALAEHLLGTRVAGLGDGLGQYRTLVLDTGLVDSYDAFDGSPFVEELTKGQVRFLDLGVPQFWLPVYDWTVCLEVLEHVPSRYETTAVDNVVRAARVGVVLSWARPGQGGLGHVSTRPQKYVDELMTQRGFELDIVTSNKLRDAATFAWFKFTLNVYRRTNVSLEVFDSMRRTEVHLS